MSVETPIGALCALPADLHPLAASALEHWLIGNIGAFDFLHYATLVNSDNFGWVTCLLGA